jgi:hypothetical protein
MVALVERCNSLVEGTCTDLKTTQQQQSRYEKRTKHHSRTASKELIARDQAAARNLSI